MNKNGKLSPVFNHRISLNQFENFQNYKKEDETKFKIKIANIQHAKNYLYKMDKEKFCKAKFYSTPKKLTYKH